MTDYAYSRVAGNMPLCADQDGNEARFGNRLTGEYRDIITSKLTLADKAHAVPGFGGLLASGGTLTIPFSSEFSAEIKRHLARGMTVVRAWDVLWPKDGSAPRVINDTGYLTEF